MFDLLHTHIEPEYKKCYSIYTTKDIDCTRSPIVRLSFETFYNKEDFETRCLNIAFSDLAKHMTSGQPFNGVSLIVANDFGENGQVIDKHICSLINHLTKKHNLKVYPSAQSSQNYIAKLKEVQWPPDVDLCEPDYMSLLHTILATKKSFGKNLLSVCFDYEYDKSFDQFFKYYHIDIVNDPKDAVLVTNKYIDLERAKEIANLKPNTVISFNDACIWESYGINDAPMGILRMNNIHLVPSGITKIGNTIIADTFVNSLRSLEQAFQLVETTGQRVETLWKIALESRINFNDIVSEITKAKIAANRFKLKTYDVGVNIYKA